MCNFGRGYHEEQFCEIILNLGHSFRRRRSLKGFFFFFFFFGGGGGGALAALLLSGAEPFKQFLKWVSWETFM